MVFFYLLTSTFFRFAGFNGVTNPGATSSQQQQQQLTAARPAPVAQLGEAVRSSQQLSSQSAVRSGQPSSQPFTAFRHAVATSVIQHLRKKFKKFIFLKHERDVATFICFLVNLGHSQGCCFRPNISHDWHLIYLLLLQGFLPCKIMNSRGERNGGVEMVGESWVQKIRTQSSVNLFEIIKVLERKNC
jgi:hypothetical protein